MPNITSISGRAIKDSRGKDTIEVTVITKSGHKGVAGVPGGTSTGSFEAAVLPVDQSLRIIEELISPKLAGHPVDDQRGIDRKLIAMDGSERKERLGGNTLIGVSLAVARAASEAARVPLYRYIASLAGTKPQLPTPLCVVICGGKHSDSGKPTFQEFSVGAALSIARNIYDTLASRLPAKTGLEGAFAPAMSNTDALRLITDALEEENLQADGGVKLGLDMAATTLERPPEVAEIVELVEHFPIGLLEDPLPEEAWHLWAQLKLELSHEGHEILLVGDDLFVTNRRRLEKGITELIANAILIKPNQVGTLTETLEVITIARQAGFKHIVSHRSGETTDDFITDLAVATGATYLKAGSPSPDFPERAAKYARLAAIARELA